MLFGSRSLLETITFEKREDSLCENTSEPHVCAAHVLAELKKSV